MLSAPARFWSQSQFRSADHIAGVSGTGALGMRMGFGGLETEDGDICKPTANKRNVHILWLYCGLYSSTMGHIESQSSDSTPLLLSSSIV